jgi:hypothetical protein
MDDRQAIIDLTYTYAWSLDLREFDGLRSVFAPDATASLRGMECVGVDGIIERISSSILKLDATQHLVSNHQVVIDGDTATCRCQLQSQHAVRGTGPNGGDGTFLIGGYYDDRLERRAEGWRIVHRTLVQTWMTGDYSIIRRPAS